MLSVLCSISISAATYSEYCTWIYSLIQICLYFESSTYHTQSSNLYVFTQSYHTYLKVDKESIATMAHGILNGLKHRIFKYVNDNKDTINNSNFKILRMRIVENVVKAWAIGMIYKLKGLLIECIIVYHSNRLCSW